MASFASMTANLNLNIQNFAANMRRASTLAKQFSSDLKGQINDGLIEPVKASKFEFKDVARIVQGIIISKVFYSGLNSIRNCTNAVWEFSQQLEYAKIAYSNLFGDVALADEFINVLKDFAATTPFSFQESEAAAKRLLAYGIQYKNVMYVMQGVLAASSMQGNPRVIESVSRAIGQIYTKGRLMNEEMRQLAEAGIPAYDILQQKLGLTQKQLQNLGNEAIPASVAINALIDGMNERFGGVVTASSRTITGIISNIKDNATMIASEAFQPVIDSIRVGLNALGQFLFRLREIIELKGLGGVMEELFPPEMHDTIRQFAASFIAVHTAGAKLVVTLGGLLKPVLEALLRVYNAFAPILTTLLNALSAMISIITSNAKAMNILATVLAAAAAMWVVFKIRALAAAAVTGVITLISKALAGLSAMLTFVAAHPFWALLIGITGVVVGLSGGFGKLSDAIGGYFKKLNSFNGVDPDKLLLPSQEERANDLNKFNEALDGTSDAMDDLADSTGNATKAAKGLLSFDEVFKLKEPDEGTDSGIDSGMDFEVPDLSGIGGEQFVPEIPDFTGFAETYVESLVKALKDKIAAAGIGALLGAALGAMLGGQRGMKIGAIAGGIAGLLWNAIADALGLTPDEKVKAAITTGIGTTLGAIIGGIFGGPLGAKIGAILGTFAGAFWGLLAQSLGVTDQQQYRSLIAAAFTGFFAGIAKYITGSSIVTMINSAGKEVFAGFAHAAGSSLKDSLKFGIIGAIANLAVGLLSDALIAWLAKEFELTDQDIKNGSTGQLIGNIVGSITGMILGGPVGSIIGGSLGNLAGSVLGAFWEHMNNTLKGAVIGGAAGLPTGALIGTLVGSIGGPLGAALGAAIGTALGALTGLIVDNWEAISGFFVDMGNGIATFFTNAAEWFSTGWDSLTTGVGTFFGNLGQWFTQGFNSVSTWLGNIWNAISTSVAQWFEPIGVFFSDVANGLTVFATDLWNGVTTVFNDLVTAISTVMNDIWTAVTTVWNDIVTAVSTVCTTLWETLSNIFNLIKDLIVKVVTDAWNAVVTWFTPIGQEISRVCSEAWNAVSTWFQNIWNTIVEKLTGAWNAVSQWFQNMWNTIVEKLTGAWNAVSQWFQNMWNTAVEKLTGMWNAITQWFGNIYNTIKTKITDSYNAVKTGIGNMYESFKNGISNMYNTVKSGISNIYKTFTKWISNMWDNVFGKFFGWINDGITKLREFFGLESSAKSTSAKYTTSTSTRVGHATGGIFNREHIARFAEGNKAEAVIPLENAGAMQPFVDAVANGITASLMPIVANFNGNQNQLQPLYVGTLIADDRSLKELQRKMQIIQLQEDARRGR